MSVAMLRRASQWQYKSSSGGSVGAGPVAGQMGEFVLTDPSGQDVKFNWVSLGGGASIGIELPTPSIGVSTAAMPDVGSVHILPWFTGKELNRHHFTGLCGVREFSAGFGVGGSIMEMYFGIELPFKPAVDSATNLGNALMGLGKLGLPITVPVLVPFRAKLDRGPKLSIKGVMYVAGMAVGKQFGLGANVLLGSVW